MEPVKTTGMFGLIYANDAQSCLPFYEKYFNFQQKFTMDDGSCYGTIGEIGLWIGDKYQARKTHKDDVRSAFMIEIDNAQRLFENLKADGVEIVHEKPVEMQPGVFWFMFYDPAGNILEVLGN